jgi:hypothetical protein
MLQIRGRWIAVAVYHFKPGHAISVNSIGRGSCLPAFVAVIASTNDVRWSSAGGRWGPSALTIAGELSAQPVECLVAFPVVELPDTGRREMVSHPRQYGGKAVIGDRGNPFDLSVVASDEAQM